MRRTDREITSRPEIDAIINDCAVCRLAFAVSGEPYLVPVSFGYDGERLYFHTAKTGKKIDCIAANNRVCFELERNVELITHERTPCAWSFAYESVVGFGTVHELLAPEEKAAALNRVMDHYSGRTWEFAGKEVESTRVWEIRITSVTGKRSGQKDV